MTQSNDSAMQWQVTCDCGWRVRGTKEQVVSSVQHHGQSVHDATLTEEQVMAIAVQGGQS